MATPVPDGPSTGGARRSALAPWRRLRAALAAAIVLIGALWLALVAVGPWGPLTGNLLTSILFLVFLVWILVDALVRELTKRARPREHG